jgi:hypothetical protein
VVLVLVLGAGAGTFTLVYSDILVFTKTCRQTVVIEVADCNERWLLTWKEAIIP